MSLKVFQLAKELAIDSKVIVKKCKDEQVPNIETHMSPVSAGLAATIREWFASGDMKTAIEQTEHIDKSKVAKPRKRSSGSKKGSQGSHESSGDSATAVAEPPAHGDADSNGVEMIERPHHGGITESIIHDDVPFTPDVAEPAEETTAVTPIAEETATAPAASPPEVVAPAHKHVAPAEAPPIETPPARHAAAAHAPTKQAPVKPVAPVLQKPVRPPVRAMGIPNVPTRPTSVSPAGPQVRPSAAQMQGPKVVRVEQPDQLPAPRARPRPPMGGGQGGQGGQSNQGQGGQGPGTMNRPATPGFGMPSMPTSTGAPGRGRSTGGKEVPIDDEEAAAKKKGRPAARRGVGTGRRGDAGVTAIKEWREADLLERQGRIAGAAGVLRDRKREMIKQQRHLNAQPGAVQKPTHIEIAPPVTIRQLAEALGVKGSEILKKLMAQGVMATVNQVIDPEAAQVMALEFGLELIVKAKESQTVRLEREYKANEETAEKVMRAPVVTILGHVDHGKTSLLDKIRSANVASGEAGGITQHVGAYTVELAGGDGKMKRVTFLDTPGHQAFTAMRARGANMTDVVVLVVAADDGVMPQTVESINHAKAAGVPIVVALNKIDKQEANANKVLGQLAENGLNPAEWGGDTEVVRTSAVSGQGIKELIEYLDYTATLKELKASPALPARGCD